MGKPTKQKQRQDLISGHLPIDFDRKIYPSQAIEAFVDELATDGISAAAALQDTGLSEANIRSHATSVSYAQINTAIRNAIRLSRRPTFALCAGQRMHVTAYGMYGYALLSSRTADEAWDFGARHIRIVGALCEFSTAMDGLTGICTLKALSWPDPGGEVHRFAAEFSLAAHLTATRDWSSPNFNFSRVLLDYDAPAHAHAYEELFGCANLFNQPQCQYEFLRGDDPLPLANARTCGMARAICARLLDELSSGASAVADVKRLLIEQTGRYPSIEAAAKILGTYARALRRRLEAEGSSYRQIVSEVRTQLAVEYLRKTTMTLEEIASRLGYSDATTFRRAFIRHTGRKPRDYR